MLSPFHEINEDIMRQDRKVERMGIAVRLIAGAFAVLILIALKYAVDLYLALQVFLPGLAGQ
ncbi:hypothetical protein TG4357_02676 [Thalassovita gelatinovora]|uniref:Uncharacterized protein n=1 Tax=Thalassovita gelatinovora TaxID=53501 RepID=A0A0P1FFC6_THAGE|nr:hypothetical protein [Thalassovita gelatinovora]QIZ79802.1 hypothetical protein HFZ77_04550 [Thalassovita gelatinovora]CUH66849.1 hypothetical protein TG4357_02676 [Thalassovita gelatinovora]SEQ43871.1 hypothetical protein SAMN04488043_105213 [Thalassovita gelatinovora]